MSKVLIIGAGPAGLSAGYFLSKDGNQTTILELNPTQVGGLAKTVEKNGFKFDIGGHRFYTQYDEVQAFWNSLLDNKKFVERKRKSRILFDGIFFEYPIRISECFQKFSLKTNITIAFSYLINSMNFLKPINNFEDWVIKKLGRKLYLLFFKNYTEKVWGISCKDISNDWAEQRIQGLSIFSLLVNSFKQTFFKSFSSPKTLISKFHYPLEGPGQMWNSCRDKIEEQEGSKVLMGHKFLGVKKDGVKWKANYENPQGELISEVYDNIISTIPINIFIESIEMNHSDEIYSISKRFKHRDFLTIALMTKEKTKIDDNWIYVHDETVNVARVQFFHNWSEYMTPNESDSCIGMEYFCSRDDSLWKLNNEDLKKMAIKEALDIGLIVNEEDVFDYEVIRAPHAYPIYHDEYKNDLNKLKTYLNENCPGIQLCGRNGLHRYNNQDHSILTAIACYENIIGKENARDPWDLFKNSQFLEVQ
jgi:protoporphyrinogen oxidase